MQVSGGFTRLIEPVAARLGIPKSHVYANVLLFDDVTGEMTLVSLHPGVTVEKVQESTPWKLKTAQNIQQTPAPSERELAVVRALDPDRTYLG